MKLSKNSDNDLKVNFLKELANRCLMRLEAHSTGGNSCQIPVVGEVMNCGEEPIIIFINQQFLNVI